MARRVLVDNAYFVLSLDDATGILWLVRTPLPFASFEALHAATGEVAAGTGIHAGRPMLIDAREGPARNDPDFEREFALARRRMMAPCAKVAVLVRSAMGRLQVARYVREDRAATQGVFFAERDAVAYLKAP